MPIPDYQAIMRPLLEALADGGEHRLRDLRDGLSRQFELTDDERAEMLPSGVAPVFTDRVAWARYYLQRAGMLRQTQRSVYVITEAGTKLLEETEGPLTNAHLRERSADFRRWLELSRGGGTRDNRSLATEAAGSAAPERRATPEESLASAYNELRATVEADLLARLKAAPPDFFERVVVRLLVAMGYGGSLKDAGRAVGRTGDEGVDGIINEDRLGLDVVYIQAKRWSSTVSRPDVQQFAGALAGKRARKGVFITTSGFSADAVAYARSIEPRIILINGEQLAAFMFEHDVGVSPSVTYEVKRIDTDFFEED